MFTGLVEAVCRVEWARPQGRGRELAVRLGPLAEGVRPGDSVALSGVCATAERLAGPVAVFHLGEETLACTWFGSHLKTGVLLNVERALRLGDRLGGHLVQGHVDGTGQVRSWDKGGREGIFSVQVPAELAPFLAPKGSVALDGVSLTVAALAGDRVDVALIPHTAQGTTLAGRVPGDPIHVEVDLLARYLQRLLQARGL